MLWFRRKNKKWAWSIKLIWGLFWPIIILGLKLSWTCTEPSLTYPKPLNSNQPFPFSTSSSGCSLRLTPQMPAFYRHGHGGLFMLVIRLNRYPLIH
ncbi:unnamed protein product [Arabidopsis lyrata]|nr:unnamed protein product [Arabidopsis lyrata]